jgi:hypothetical protein
MFFTSFSLHYLSAVVDYWSAEKNKMLKIDLKKVPSPNIFLHDYVGTMTKLFMKKKSHFTILLSTDDKSPRFSFKKKMLTPGTAQSHKNPSRYI